MADKPAAYSPTRPTQPSQPSLAFDGNHQQSQSMAAPSSTFTPITSTLHSNSSPSSSSFRSPFASLPNTMASQIAPAPLSHGNPLQSPATPAGPATATATMDHNQTKKMDITTLMSPPDPILDSFTAEGLKKAHITGNGSHSTQRSSGSSAKQPLPMSPPVSPYSKSVSHPSRSPSTPAQQSVSDPVLYPTDDTATPSPNQAPLFAPQQELEDHRKIVDDHLQARSAGNLRSVDLPTREAYHLVLSFKSQVIKHFQADPKSWLRKERALLQSDRRASAHRYHAIMPAKPKPIIAAKPPRGQRADRVTKPASSAPGSAAPRTIRNGGPVVNPSKRVSTSRTSLTPEPSKRAVAPNREDKDFNSLPDYCPPGSSLPSRPNSLKVEWKGQPIDLSTDPHASLLHPDEVLLAGNLRLDCATYLTSKRRIFERRLQCLRTGKEFRKTDAQQACKIDVNKASKLWTAFDRVGWLEAGWVRKYL